MNNLVSFEFTVLYLYILHYKIVIINFNISCNKYVSILAAKIFNYISISQLKF